MAAGWARRRGGWLLAAAALLVLLWWGRGRLRPPPPRYATVEVSRGALAAQVTATGVLSALVTVSVGSQLSGRISELHADFNQSVRKGQLLARIDRGLPAAAAEKAAAAEASARLQWERAQVRTEDAGRRLYRQQSLAARRLVAEAEVDAARTERQVALADEAAARAALRQAAAAHREAQLNLSYAEIVSPVDGVVLSRRVDLGQTVAATLQAPELFVIAEDLRRMQVDTSIAEADVALLAAGMEATFSVDAHPGRIFAGRVREVRNAPQTVQNVVTYDAVVDVANDDLALRPGMTANLMVVHDRREAVVRVPNAALRFRPPPQWISARAETLPSEATRQRQVWRLGRDDRPEPVDIRVGLSDGTLTELVEGPLQPGDRLVSELLSGEGSKPGSYGRML